MDDAGEATPSWACHSHPYDAELDLHLEKGEL
jgi:hypothetical protein